VGATDVDLFGKWADAFIKVSKQRLNVYKDATEMEDTVDEVEAALDILADEAVNAELGEQKSFRIAFPAPEPPRGVQDFIVESVQRAGWHDKAFGIARETLLYGDNFLQNVVHKKNLQVVRLMSMPPESMVRNEDLQGLLKRGTTEGEWAFEQYANPSSHPTLIAGFYPWQILHIRWNRRGRNPYGRSLLYTARTPWKKLRAMEESLVINWLTRAFARLLFILDVTGKSPKEAEAYIEAFKRKLATRKIASGVLGIEQMSVVKDIYIGKGFHERGGRLEEGVTDVKVLDTSRTAFTNLSAIEYYQNKIITSLRVPKAYLGLERDINARATLLMMDRRFARTVRRVQSLLGWGITQTVALSLALQGMSPADVEFEVRWPSPSRTDEYDVSRVLYNKARAIKVLIDMNVVDREYSALRLLNMDRREWERVAKEVQRALQQQQESAG